MTDVKFKCDNCENVLVSSEPNKKVIKNKVHVMYQECNECKHRHIMYCTNDRIRRDINKVKRLHRKRSAIDNIETSRMYLAKIHRLDKLLQTDMNKLKEQTENISWY